MHALSFSAHPITVVVGQVVFADGSPVASSRITNVEAFASTDQQGWFQLELTKPQPIELYLGPNESCRVELPAFTDADGLSVIDPLVCDPQ